VLKHAADAAPKSAQAQVNLARAYLLAARPEEAAAALRNALARDGNHYPALLMSATLASREGWSPELEATLARMKAIAPDESHAYLIEAEHLMQTRQEKKAARALEAAIARRPQDAVALNNLAWLYHTLRDDRALDVARRAYAIAGGRAEIADTYGWLLVESGRVPDGLQILRQVGGPGAPEEIRLHLAQALARNGAVKEARQIAAELAAGPVGSKAVNGAQALLGRLGGG
jgi:Tfp pilus assembly protein PilF